MRVKPRMKYGHLFRRHFRTARLGVAALVALICCAPGSWASLKKQRPDWLRDKKVTLLMQGALQRDAELPDLPSALDFVKNDADRKVMELFFTQKTIARPVIAPPGLAPERLATLRAAFAALATDRDFLADAERSNLDVAPMSGEAVDKVVALIASTPADVADRFAAIFSPPGQSR
jgi:hypothetical protein